MLCYQKVKGGTTRCPKIKVSIKNLNSDLLITLLHSVLIDDYAKDGGPEVV